MTLALHSLWQYPLKSGIGNPLTQAHINEYGFEHDRILMAVNASNYPGQFLSSRQTPALLFIQAKPIEHGWQLIDTRSHSHITIRTNALDKDRQPINIWKDKAEAYDGGDEAAEWLSQAIDKPARLAVWFEQSRLSGKYDIQTRFADASPILITSEASIRQACEWGGVAYDLRRFRPNIVVNGIEAFAEENWDIIRIGELRLQILDPCPRCVLITRDPDTGTSNAQREPMRSLTKHHAGDQGMAILGMNAVALNNATINLDDTVTIERLKS